MPHFPKPAEGSWTEHLGLDTGLVSYADSISPEHFELERDAIFRRTWLNVGRVEQLPSTGSYFTKELVAARTSVVVVRDGNDEIRAFEGNLTNVRPEPAFSDFDPSEYGLAPVRVDVWEGFVFVNLDGANAAPLRAVPR